MATSRISNLTVGQGRLAGVDILRGIALFLVLMNHVNMRLVIAKLPYTEGLPDQLVDVLVWNGQYGVQMFFVISGFLITSTSLRRWESLSQVAIRDFYTLRFARIAPLLLLLLGVLSVLHTFGFRDYLVPAKTGGLGRALVAAFTFHVNLLEADRGYLPGSWDILWSLSVEEMFYLFFPLLCRAFGQGKKLVALLLVFVILGPFGRTAFAHGNEIWQEYSYLGGMDAIALGCLTAMALNPMTISRAKVCAMGGLGISSLIFVLGFGAQAKALGLVRSGLDMTLCAGATCLLVAAAAQTRWRGPRVVSPVARFGQHSYEVYLTHMFVVFMLFNLFVAMGSPVRGVPALFLGVILVTGVLGNLVARFYSEPMNRLIRGAHRNVARPSS